MLAAPAERRPPHATAYAALAGTRPAGAGATRQRAGSVRQPDLMGQVQLLRRPPEVAMVDDRDERPDLGEVQVHNHAATTAGGREIHEAVGRRARGRAGVRR
jgi:hypothetical protein